MPLYARRLYELRASLSPLCISVLRIKILAHICPMAIPPRHLPLYFALLFNLSQSTRPSSVSATRQCSSLARSRRTKLSMQ